ncbi:ABC transporter substrate-binding protein [Pseudonocardia sichuanensis]
MNLQSARMNRRKVLRVFGLGGGAVVLGGLAGCGDDGGEGASGGGGGGPLYLGEAAVTHLEANISATPFLVAQGLGIYEDHGLELELVSFPGGADAVRGVASIGFGMPATLATLTAYQKGQDDLRLIAGCDNRARAVFLVPAVSEIRTIEDLEGKRIAVSQPGSITTYFANRIARQVGLTPGEDVEILNVGGAPDAWTAVTQGVANVAWGFPPSSEILINDGAARVLFDSADYVTKWTDTSHWATESLIDESPDVLQAFLRAQQDAITAIKNDLDTAAPAYAERINIPLEVARSTLVLAGEGLSLEIDRDAIQAVIAAGIELGQVEEGLDLDALIVSRFVENL